MGNINEETEIIRRNHIDILKQKSTITREKRPQRGLTVDLNKEK